MAKITPEIVVSDLAQSQQFYETLGFVKEQEGIVDDNGAQWVSLNMGDAHLWLLRQDVAESLQEGSVRGNGVHLFLSVDDLDAMYEGISKAGLKMNIVKEIETLWYGLREFRLMDPDGYLWIVNMPVSQEAAESTGAS
jgi:uncharacterized glyoxalase superfamily protein PhnB